jgi:hypothetical protein
MDRFPDADRSLCSVVINAGYPARPTIPCLVPLFPWSPPAIVPTCQHSLAQAGSGLREHVFHAHFLGGVYRQRGEVLPAKI